MPPTAAHNRRSAAHAAVVGSARQQWQLQVVTARNALPHATGITLQPFPCCSGCHPGHALACKSLTLAYTTRLVLVPLRTLIAHKQTQPECTAATRGHCCGCCCPVAPTAPAPAAAAAPAVAPTCPEASSDARPPVAPAAAPAPAACVVGASTAGNPVTGWPSTKALTSGPAPAGLDAGWGGYAAAAIG